MGGKYSIQARWYSLTFATSIHTYAKQTPREQSATPIPTGTFTPTFTHKVPSQMRAGLRVQIVIRKSIPFFKNISSSGRGNKKPPTGRKRGEAVFLKGRQKERGYNLTEPMDFMVTSILTGR